MSSDVFNNLVNRSITWLTVTEYLSQMSSDVTWLTVTEYLSRMHSITWLTVTEYLSQMSSDAFNNLVNRYGISVTNVLGCVQ